MTFKKTSVFVGCLLTLLLPIRETVGQTASQAVAQQFENAPNTQKLEVPMTTPRQALEMLKLPPGFKATLFASEPDVHQPIAATLDKKGRLWVAECYTYSDRKDNYNTNLNDRIVIFEDQDNDGKFDKRTVFHDKLKKLTGIEVGMGGVWVTAAPNLMFIPDFNGDDIPDAEPRIELNGFEDNVIRHNIVNGLRWGPDGWLYGRHGIQGYSYVGAPDATESQRVPTNCCIWRYHPTMKQYEIVAQGGTNPWGFDFDEHGEMFMINTVIGHLFHVVPNARYRRMYGSHFNPHLYGVIEQTADHFHWDQAEEHWAVTKRDGMSDGTDQAGGGHAHTGLMIYQGTNWPEEFQNKLFTANFHGRRINCDSIHREGNSYVARHEPDYFKSADPWFRGIEMLYGPDGGVFLLDWSDIGECHENDGIHRTSGRIFKITFGDPPRKNKRTKIDLTKADIKQLVKFLGHDNEYYVRQARLRLQELATVRKLNDSNLVKKNPIESLKVINSLLKTEYKNATSVRHKLRIMWAMYSSDLQADILFLQDQLDDESEHIRAWAVRLIADKLVRLPKLFQRDFVAKMSNDPSGLVRLYVASAIARLNTESALSAAQQLGQFDSDAADRVQPKLVWFGLEPHLAKLLKSNSEAWIPLLESSKFPFLRESISRRVAFEIDTLPHQTERLIQVAVNTDNTALKEDILTGMRKAFSGRLQIQPPTGWSELADLLENSNEPSIRKLVTELNLAFGDTSTIESLKKVAASNEADVNARRNAFLSLAQTDQAGNLFEFYKKHLNNKSLTNVIAKVMVHCPNENVADVLIRRYPHMDPQGRTITVTTLTARPKWAKKLLFAAKNDRIPVSQISASHVRQINNFGDPELSRLVTEVWGTVKSTTKEKEALMASLRQKLSANVNGSANLKKGRELYEMNCANCHTLFGRGGKIGPDLTGSDRKNLNYLLENIVAPNATVAQSYKTSTLLLEDGRLVTGVVISENEKTLQVQTKDDLINLDVSKIESRKQSDVSLMPDGLLEKLSDEQIQDLFGYLRQ